jgi:carboxypeptidase Q
MKTRLLGALLVLSTAPLAAQDSTGAAAPIAVDTTGAGALIKEATEHSMVMKNLQYLSDEIGPRLTGSPAAYKANTWTMDRFREYGLSISLESWLFGVAWVRGPVQLQVVEPFKRNLVGHSWAWTQGTGGKVLEGKVIRVNVSTPESLAVYQDKVKGAWLITAPPAPVWNTDGPPMTAEDSANQRAFFQRMFNRPADTSAAARKQRQQFNVDRPWILKQAGALGILTDAGKEFGLMNMSGSPDAISPLPRLVIAHEDYAMLARLIDDGTTPKLSGRIDNTFGDSVVHQWNTVAEIRGSEKPDEVVILGAHLDSWDLGEGTTDNGTGSMVVLEAARIISQSYSKPKRTIRFVLFTGEEQGLFGSKAYAEQHASEMDKIQAVVVLDNGTGAITGMSLQGRSQDAQLWKDLFAPLSQFGSFVVKDGNKGGTDHLSFIPYGVPGWNYDQLSRGYNHTHHSQVDTYDHAVPGDLVQASAVMAVTAFELANLPELLPRGPVTPVTPRAALAPSAGLAKKKS